MQKNWQTEYAHRIFVDLNHGVCVLSYHIIPRRMKRTSSWNIYLQYYVILL